MTPEVLVSVSLSITGCTFTILTFLLFSDLRTANRTFSVWLAVGGLGYSSTIFFHARDETQGLMCMIESFFETYFALVTLFTTVIYSNTITKVFASLENDRNTHKIVVTPVHFVFVWILTFLIALLPYTTGSYGRNRSDLYCWIKTDSHNTHSNNTGYIWEFCVLYLWVLLAISYNLYVYMTVIRHIQNWRGNEPHIIRTKGVVYRMMLYPVILAFVFTIPLIHRLMEFFGSKPLWLVRTSIATLKLQGFLDALAYGLSRPIVARWGLVLRQIAKFARTGIWSWPAGEAARQRQEDRERGAPEAGLAEEAPEEGGGRGQGEDAREEEEEEEEIGVEMSDSYLPLGDEHQDAVEEVYLQIQWEMKEHAVVQERQISSFPDEDDKRSQPEEGRAGFTPENMTSFFGAYCIELDDECPPE